LAEPDGFIESVIANIGRYLIVDCKKDKYVVYIVGNPISDLERFVIVLMASMPYQTTLIPCLMAWLTKLSSNAMLALVL
jgi:hypothetical protein